MSSVRSKLFIIVTALLLIPWFLTGEPIIIVCFLISASCVFSLIWLSRDPERIIPVGDDIVLSAADGRVCSIVRVREHLYLDGEGILIGVYLSLFDVHINRIPASGIVRLLSYKHGSFFPACRDKSSTYNEQQITGIECNRGKILMKQIAGSIARRIVCRLRTGDKVRAGERFGMIKLGSRVELVLPPHAEIKVKIGDKVRAGETIIGVLS